MMKRGRKGIRFVLDRKEGVRGVSPNQTGIASRKGGANNHYPNKKVGKYE